jgi:hypothetical protein
MVAINTKLPLSGVRTTGGRRSDAQTGPKKQVLTSHFGGLPRGPRSFRDTTIVSGPCLSPDIGKTAVMLIYSYLPCKGSFRKSFDSERIGFLEYLEITRVGVRLVPGIIQGSRSDWRTLDSPIERPKCSQFPVERTVTSHRSKCPKLEELEKVRHFLSSDTPRRTSC